MLHFSISVFVFAGKENIYIHVFLFRCSLKENPLLIKDAVFFVEVLGAAEGAQHVAAAG